MKRHPLHLVKSLIPRLYNHVIKNGLGVGKITFGEVSVRDTDLDSQDAFVVAERVSNVGGLRVSARRGFPIAIAARGATNGDIRLDAQLGVLVGTREPGDGIEVGGAAP